MSEFMQRHAMEIQVGLQRAAIRVPGLAVIEDDISFGRRRYRAREVSGRDHPVPESVSIDRVREENGVVAIAIARRQRERVDDGANFM